MPSLSAPRATIDLDALAHNLTVARSCAPQAKLLAVVKGDGYGHGSVEVSRHLAPLVDGLAVARMDSALRLRAAGIGGRLLVMAGHSDHDSMQLASQHGLALMLHQADEVAALLATQLPAPIELWLKADTGMHRLGLDGAQYRASRRSLRDSPNVSELVQCTHFSGAENAESYATQRQLQQFFSLCADCASPRSCANSAALLGMPASHCEWVRPGIMLYGYAALPPPDGQSLRPVMTLQAPLIALRQVAAGERVGYGGAWRTARPSRIGTVAIGYADGYPRHAPNGTPVLIGEQRARLAGRVSMDLISVDLSDCGELSVGATATLWGADLPADEIAARSGTIAYDLLVGVDARLARRYVGGQAPALGPAPG